MEESCDRQDLPGEMTFEQRKIKTSRKQGASFVASAGMPGLEFAQTPFYRERSRCKDPGVIRKSCVLREQEGKEGRETEMGDTKDGGQSCGQKGLSREAGGAKTHGKSRGS